MAMIKRRALYWAIFFYFLAVVFSVGSYMPDEHYQILEFAAYKIGKTDSNGLTWEFLEQIRPSIQPALVVLLHRFWQFFGVENPFFEVFFLRFLSAVLSLFTVWQLVGCFESRVKDLVLRRYFPILMFLLWFMPYHNVRFSAECWSANMFWLGLVVYIKNGFNQAAKTLFFVGILMGLSLSIRFQLGLMLAGFGVWLLVVEKKSLGQILSFVCGVLLVFALSLAVDRWFYGVWNLAIYDYVYQNTAGGRANVGLKPIYFYVQSIFIYLVPPFSLVVIGGFFMFLYWFRSHVLTWCVVPFFVVHCLIGHKELRFLLVLIPVLPVFVVYSLQYISENHAAIWSKLQSKWSTLFVGLFVILNVFLIVIWSVVPLFPSNLLVKYYQKLYQTTKPNTVIFYTQRKPFQNLSSTKSQANFYRNKNVEILNFDSLKSLKNTNPNCHYFITVDSINSINTLTINKLKFKKIYQTFPIWFVDYYSKQNFLKPKMDKYILKTIYQLE